MGTKPTYEALEQRVRELETGVGNERADHLNRVLREYGLFHFERIMC